MTDCSVPGGKIQRSHVERAAEICMSFIDSAAASQDAREAADWALAAKHMASTVHSLAGARVTQARTA
jgi:hypothetical protein